MKMVCVKWLHEGVWDGQRVPRGSVTLVPNTKAKWMTSAGMVKIVGSDTPLKMSARSKKTSRTSKDTPSRLKPKLGLIVKSKPKRVLKPSPKQRLKPKPKSAPRRTHVVPEWVRKYDPNEPLYFLHVPRTGGTTLGNQMVQMIGNRRVIPAYGVKMEPGEVAHAHFYAPAGRGVMSVQPKARQFVTIFRDPFDRIVSRYFHLKNVWKGQAPFAGTCRTRLIDYGGCLQGFLDNFKEYYADFLPDSVPGMPNLPMILDHFILVATTSRLAAAAAFLAQMFDVNIPPMVTHNKSGKKNEEVTAKMRKGYRDTHPEEYALYDYARKKWEPVWDEFDAVK